MSSVVDVGTQVKSRHFGKALTLLKDKKESLDGRGTFKLLRSLATQLKQNWSSDETETVSEFMFVCCDILDNAHSSDLLSDQAEFTQGVLSLYYLATTLAKYPSLPVISRLSHTHLNCMRKVSTSIKDVESIAANFFSHLWNLANKAEKPLDVSYRINSLAILVHGGPSFWTRVIDKLASVCQEPSQSASKMATQVFLEFVHYGKVHETANLDWMTSLMQVWVLLVFASSKCSDHQKCTEELRRFSKGVKFHDQINWLMELLLNFFENVNGTKTTFSVQSKQPLQLVQELRAVFLRIAFLALITTSKMKRQSSETPLDNKTAHSAVIDCLLLLSGELHKYPEPVEALFQTDLHVAKLKYLARASILLNDVKMRLNEVSTNQWEKVFRQMEEVVSPQKENLNKALSLITTIEACAYNVGVHFYQKLEYSNAVPYFRKALEYCIGCLKADSNCEEVLRNFQTRLSVLYDARLRERDWTGVAEDFALCLDVCLDKKESQTKGRLCPHPIFSSMLSIWSKYKRDLQSTSPLPVEYMDTSLVDLLKKSGVSLKPKLAWDVLHEEFTALDRRKFNLPSHGALNHIAKQLASVAQTPLQKGKAYYLLSRVGSDYVQRHAYANTAVTTLAALPSQGNNEWDGQVYLALSYLELYVSQQELMKKKTAEEMQSLGPLVQSRTNADVPPGEDGSNVTTDGTSIDALSYSYLKLELEMQSQEWMVKCLQQWEELVQFGWTLNQTSNMISNCLKSLGYYFGLYGNSFYSARAWSISLKVAEATKCDEGLILAASELLRLGLTVETAIFDRCKDIISKSSVSAQEQIHFHLCYAWYNYYQQQFDKCWVILGEKVLRAPALTAEKISKSLFMEEADAMLLKSLLAVLPQELSKLPPLSLGPSQDGLKAFHSSLTALKCYSAHAENSGWDFYGQEWNVLRLFLVCSINAARIYTYIAAHREARYFLKEALNAAQRHVCALRTGEALLELSLIELMIDSVMDCQSKLLLICHMMGVTPPAIPRSASPSTAGDVLGSSPPSPVEIRSERRGRTAARKVPDLEIQVEQDATHRTLKQPYNHAGTSPSTKARELTDGVFPEHSLDCLCVTCTSELVTSIRCFMLMIQAKLWSQLNFQELANSEFVKGYQLVLTMCAKMRPAAKNSAKPNKRLFEVPEGPKLSEMWGSQKAQWLQPALVTGLELMLEHSMYSAVLNSGKSSDETSKLKTVLIEFYQGPLEHRMMKLVCAICVEGSRTDRIPVTLETMDCNSSDDSVIVVGNGGTPPKTPAMAPSKPVEMPPPRRNRRNIFGTKIDDTITIEDDDSDEAFSRRRLGKPTRPITFSSDSDSDVVPGTPPPATKSTAKIPSKFRGSDKKMEEADSSPKELKTVKKRTTRKPAADNEPEEGTSLKKPVRSRRAVTPQEANDIKAPASTVTERKLPKSGGLKSKNEGNDIESDEGNSSIDDMKTTKRRTTRKVASDRETEETNSKKTVKTSGKAAIPEENTTDTSKTPALVTERKFFKSGGLKSKNESDEIELSARLAKTTLDFEPEPAKSRPKRTTRSTKK